MTDSRQWPQILRVRAWEAFPRLVHGFLGRRGGVSRGAFAELNLSQHVGDDRAAVHENWRRVAHAAPAEMSFTTMQQVHGAHVTAVESGKADPGEADALVTATAGVALSVLTADCVPIFLVAPQHHVAAAVHAGWRGTVLGVVQRTIEHLKRMGVEAEAIHAALGPAIGGCCYEVDRSVTDELEQRWGAMPAAVRGDRGPKTRLDLRVANNAILVRAGVPLARITHLGPCTKCAAAEYFSYRAAGGPTGRQLSFIGWRE